MRTAPEMICTPANYIYFDLIVSYLIILTTKFVKLPILWSQILPCRSRKQILFDFFLGLSGRCHHAPAKASSSTPPRFLSTPPPERKYENPSLNYCLLNNFLFFGCSECRKLHFRVSNYKNFLGIIPLISNDKLRLIFFFTFCAFSLLLFQIQV